MVQTLHQAHDEIKNNIDKKNYVLAQDMISQCQECAISIGTAIEKFEGEGFVTVSFVEAYCDVLFSIYEELNGSDVNANKIYKNLKKQLLRIENSIKNDVPIRKEVAFFPYKASMWDALESVYLAAKEDPDCDAYCVPIPYYDRNPDKSLGQMHYEGNEYPKNIEIVDWQTYNFEERKPDAIYIHNPYDDWNLVTCVHPRYFSANLKKYTEKLVYIPYFVLDEIEPDDQASIDGMKHFCFLPGVINADKVVVQSEKMRQIYINEYQKAAQANGLPEKHIDRKQLEEKFLGTGSPKFDKVLNTKKEDLDIPEEWLKIIQKPDGSWKKIIFYNTSIAALLENNEKMLEKMKDVFRIFKENKDEVALLWRPHPLIKTTVSAMRPQLWVEYEKLVKQYKEEGWGIYDKSSDVDRAVVLSDAYYGDASSVLILYKKTQKQIMIQSLALENMKPMMSYDDLCEDETNLYLLCGTMNVVLTLDKRNMKLVDMISYQVEQTKIGTYNKIVSYENKVILIPRCKNQILCIDKKDKACCTIEIPKASSKNAPLFGNTLLADDRMLLIPQAYNWIISLKSDMSYAIYELDMNEGTGINTDAVIEDNSLLFLNNGKMILFDFSTKSSSFYLSGGNYKAFCKSNNKYVLINNQTIDLYDYLLKEKIISISFPENKVKKCISYGNYVFMCEPLEGNIYFLDSDSKEKKVQILTWNEENLPDINNYEWLEMKLLGDYIWCSSLRKQKIFKIDARNLKVDYANIELLDREKGYKLYSQYGFNNYEYSLTGFDLKGLITFS